MSLARLRHYRNGIFHKAPMGGCTLRFNGDRAAGIAVCSRRDMFCRRMGIQLAEERLIAAECRQMELGIEDVLVVMVPRTASLSVRQQMNGALGALLSHAFDHNLQLLVVPE